jgi:hypothetical protein
VEDSPSLIEVSKPCEELATPTFSLCDCASLLLLKEKDEALKYEVPKQLSEMVMRGSET